MLGFLKCVAEAAVENGLEGLLALVPGGPYASAVASAALKKCRERKKLAEQRAEIQQLAEATFEQARVGAVEAVRQVLAEKHVTPLPEEIIGLELWLASVPEATRVSLKRKDDPSGRSLPVEREAPVVIPSGQSEVQLKVRAGADAAVGVHRISLTGMSGKSEVGNFLSPVGRSRAATAFVELTVSEPYLVATIRRAAVERGRRGEIVCDLKHAKQLPGPATAALRRLPNGVTLVEPLPTIHPGDKQVAFIVEVSRDALVGQYKDIYCEVTVTEKGQSIRQQTGSGTLRVDPARETPVPKR